MDHLVYVVDDDDRLRESLLDLLESCELKAIAFRSALEYLEFAKPDVAGCLLLDLELPDINGLDLQARLGPGHHPPIIFLTGHGDIPSSVRALKAGAVDFFTKPFQRQELVGAIRSALAVDRAARAQSASHADLAGRFEGLTRRQKEVFCLVTSGLLNKQAAAELGISEVTLQFHRGKIMQKMNADSLAELVRMAEKLNVQPTHLRHPRR